MRLDVSQKNAERIFEAIKQIREETGVELSPNRVGNLYLAAIDSAEFLQILTITLRTNPEAGKEEVGRKRSKTIKRTTNWATNL